MQWGDLLAALALVFVLEGLLPFLSPGGYRKAMRMATELNDSTLRVIGVSSMLIGLVLLAVVR